MYITLNVLANSTDSDNTEQMQNLDPDQAAWMHSTASSCIII